MRRGAALVLLAAATTACSSPTSGNSDTLRLAQAAEIYSLDPDAAADSQSRAMLCNIYEGLVALDRELAIVPALAVSWSTPDERTWEFELRRGVRFHDGRPLTAADVKFSLDRVGGLSTALDPVAGLASVEVVDEHRVRLRTPGPDPLLLNRLTQLLVVPASDSLPDAQPVGTGPYRVVRRAAGRLELEAFPWHWRGAPQVKRVLLLSVPNADAVESLAHDEVDVYRLLPAEAAASLASQGGARGYRVAGRPGLSITSLAFDCLPRDGQASPFADVRVRRAVSLALDRSEIARRLGGRDRPANQLVPEGVFGFLREQPPLPHDLDAARGLLREAGLAGGFATPLAHGPGHRTLAAAVREMLAPVGIRVQPVELGWREILKARRDRRFGFLALDWTFDDGDAWSFLMASLHTPAGPLDLRSTNAGYSNPALDRLIDESRHAPTIETRLEKYAAAHRLALAELPLVPVSWRHDLYAVSERVRFEPRLDGKLVVSEMALEPGR